MTRGIQLFALLALGAPLAGRAIAQTDVAAVDSARRLQQGGYWKEARGLLTAELQRCVPGSDGRGCRNLLFSALGYLNQQQAVAEPAQREILLGAATQFYRQALGENSRDGVSLRNLALAYRSLGRDEELSGLVDAAIPADSSGAVFYALLLGAADEQRGRWDAAVAVYRRAIVLAPNDEAPRRRLVDAYRRLPADSVAGLFRLVSNQPDWEARFPDVTARAYELVVSTLASRDGGTARRACLRWIDLLSETELLSSDRLDAIGASWLTAPVAQLKAFLDSPSRPPADAFWRDPTAGESLQRVALALGRRRAGLGDVVGADGYWQMGIRIGQFRAPSPVTLDLVLESAGLYQRYPSLDPDSAKFRRLEEYLFAEKSQAYESADKETVQQLHTVLGLIYAARGIWRSAAPWTNATYQLEHALTTARQRDAAGGSYQPLPGLRARLAEGYAQTGRRAEALETYVSAAQAYLDGDDPATAQTMLVRAGTLVGEGGSAARMRALESLVRARSVEYGGPVSRPRLDVCQQRASDATSPPVTAQLDPAFLTRQRFKLLADCVLAGSAPVRPSDAAHVFNFVARANVSLVGSGDVVRLQQSEAAVRQVLDVPTQAIALERRGPKPVTGALRVQLSNDSRPRYIPISADAVLGNSIIERLGDEGAVRHIMVRKGQVTVQTDDVSSADKARILQTIQSVGGVESMRVYERPSLVIPPPAPAPPPTPPALHFAPPGAPVVLPEPPIVPPQAPIVSMQQGAVTANALAAIVPDSMKPSIAGNLRSAFQASVAAYARALESRDTNKVRGVVRNFDASALDGLFHEAGQLRARLELADLTVHGDHAVAKITGVLEYLEGGVPRSQRITQRAEFIQMQGEWRMLSVR